ncbi:hypothetical protein ABH935_009533, partial [Catenulispora sp. GAS73]
QGDHKQRPPADSATPLPGASAARRAGAAGGPVFDFQAPTTPDDRRLRNACAVTRTRARSCTRTPPAANATCGTPPNCATQRILLKPTRSRKKLLKPTNKPHPPHPSHPHPHPHLKQRRRKDRPQRRPSRLRVPAQATPRSVVSPRSPVLPFSPFSPSEVRRGPGATSPSAPGPQRPPHPIAGRPATSSSVSWNTSRIAASFWWSTSGRLLRTATSMRSRPLTMK